MESVLRYFWVPVAIVCVIALLIITRSAGAACPPVQYPEENVCFSDDTTLADRFASVVASSGVNEGETTLNTGTYTLMLLSLTEAADANATFTVNANEVCYTGTPTMVFRIVAAYTVDRTTGNATDTVSFSFGIDTTGAIGDGDEFGEVFDSAVTQNNAHVTGALAGAISLDTNDCIGVLGITDDVTGGAGWTMHAMSLHLTAH